MLQVVEIFIDTPTFTKITKEVKTNFTEKLSLIYGVCGLFAGFSMLSVLVEIVYFILKTVKQVLLFWSKTSSK